MKMEELRATANSPRWDEEETRATYLLPLPMEKGVAETGKCLLDGMTTDQLFKIKNFLCAQSPETHIGPFRWAVDFLVIDGTPVLAARDGRIIEVQELHNEWGNGPEFSHKLNLVTIEHTDGEFSQYCHLAQMSVQAARVHVGSLVKRVQVIGTVGKTGWTDRDHLHFIVFRSDKNRFGFKSLKIRFE